jgi:hypothetical protein
MRKILALILAISLIFAPFPAIAYDQFGDSGSDVLYRGTATGLRISASGTNDFVDNLIISALPQNGKVVAGPTAIAAASALLDATTANAFYGGGVNLSSYQTGNYAVRFRNTSGGGIAEAYISSTAPSGEALGDEIFTSTDFTTDWTNTGNWSVAAGTATHAGQAGIDVLYQLINRPYGELHKLSINVATATSGSLVLYDNNGTSAEMISAPITTTGTKAFYNTYLDGTPLTAGISTDNGSFSGSINAPSYKPVTMPVATGALLLSTKGGSRGWYRKDSSFNPNAVMTIEVIDISLTAFTDKNHRIEIYSSNGAMLAGVLGAAGTGETLSGVELITNGTFATNITGWDTYGGIVEDTYEWDGTGALRMANTSAHRALSGTANTALFALLTGRLEKVTYDLTLNSGSLAGNGLNIAQGYHTGSDTYALTKAAGTGVTTYFTCKASANYGFEMDMNSVHNISLDNVSVQQVLTPSAFGTTIVSMKNGVTQTFTSKSASFIYNEATNYVIVKRLR